MITKPLFGTKINFLHPLTKDCVGIWLMNENAGSGLENSINRKITSNPSLRWSSNKQGSCLSVSNGDNIDLGLLKDLFPVSSIQTFSFVLGVQQKDLTYNDNTNLSHLSFQAQIPNVDGSVIWEIDGLSTEAPIGYYNQNKDITTWTFTNSPERGIEIWQNSKLISYNTLLNPSITIEDNLFLGDKTGNYCYLYVYKKCLSADEIKSLSNDPFQFLRKQYYLFKDKSVKLSGTSEVSTYFADDTVASGIEASGVGSDAYINTPYLSEGGLTAGGLSLNLRTKVEIASGGVLLSGNTIIGVDLVGTGGAILSGTSSIMFYDVIEEVLDGEGVDLSGFADIQYISKIISSGSGLLSGIGNVSDIFAGRGGVLSSGENNPEPGSTTAIPSGGISCGGVTRVGWAITEYASFGLRVTGRAINTRRGTVQNVHSGYALAMLSTNFVKTKLAKSLEPVKIIIPKSMIIDEEPTIDYRIEQVAEWCYIEDCDDNVLPRIIEKRQGTYIPKQKRDAQARNRQIARATGL